MVGNTDNENFTAQRAVKTLDIFTFCYIRAGTFDVKGFAVPVQKKWKKLKPSSSVYLKKPTRKKLICGKFQRFNSRKISYKLEGNSS